MLELTSYADGPVIVRDNCRTNLFFCGNAHTCEPLRTLGQLCQHHRDCASVRVHLPPSLPSSEECLMPYGTKYTCAVTENVCASAPHAPFVVPAWTYGVISLSIISGT